MAKLLNKLYARVVISVAFGFLLAGTSTHIQYSCVSSTAGENCVSFEKAVIHPSDLINNKQGSLTDFAGTLAISSLVSFALLSVYSQAQKKKS